MVTGLAKSVLHKEVLAFDPSNFGSTIAPNLDQPRNHLTNQCRALGLHTGKSSPFCGLIM